MKKVAMAAILCMAATSVAAQTKNVVRNCYASTQIESASANKPDAEIFVLIDETTILDDGLKQEAINKATSFLRDGRAFSVARFSAFVQGRYADVIASGTIQPDLSQDQRDSLPRPKVREFDSCHIIQAKEAHLGIGKAMLQTMNGATDELIRSDIMTSLQQISTVVAQSLAARKVIFIVSDMLENSSIDSFYLHNAVKKIDVNRALSAADKAQSYGDFAGADVYVEGAGILDPKTSDPKASYRDPDSIHRLQAFWQEWFKRSHATLREFGRPALVGDLQ